VVIALNKIRDGMTEIKKYSVYIYKKGNKIRISSSSWNYSILGFIAVIILMFSGFVLKADLDASGAAQVAFSLIKDTPALKYLLPLFKDNSVFYYKFFIWHIVYLPLVLAFAIYKHIDTLKVKSTILSIAFGITVLSMIVFKMPLDIIPGEKVKTLSSPWFFIGAEHLLQKAWTPLSINLFLSIPFFLLIIYFCTKYKYTTKSLLTIFTLANKQSMSARNSQRFYIFGKETVK